MKKQAAYIKIINGKSRIRHLKDEIRSLRILLDEVRLELESNHYDSQNHPMNKTLFEFVSI
ncbi:hypothetical protein BVX98_05320 [bacterium F11]|nr:hypothetical protein BVX98_05320 [bacterium F11]